MLGSAHRATLRVCSVRQSCPSLPRSSQTPASRETVHPQNGVGFIRLQGVPRRPSQVDEVTLLVRVGLPRGPRAVMRTAGVSPAVPILGGLEVLQRRREHELVEPGPGLQSLSPGVGVIQVLGQRLVPGRWRGLSPQWQQGPFAIEQFVRETTPRHAGC